MKRKLDANDVPSPEPAGTEEQELDFEALKLDPRLCQALIKEKFTKPTLVQAKAIPLALEGKDILGEFPSCLPSHDNFDQIAQLVRRLGLVKPLPMSCPSCKRFSNKNPLVQSSSLGEVVSNIILTGRPFGKSDHRPHPRPDPRARRASPKSRGFFLQFLRKGCPVRQPYTESFRRSTALNACRLS